MERPLGHLHRLREHRQLGVRHVGILRLDLEDPEQVQMFAVLFEQRTQEPRGFAPHRRLVEQALKRSAARGVGAVDRERARVRLEARGEIGDLRLPDVAEPSEELEPLAVGVREPQVRLESLREVDPPLGGRVEPLERAEGRLFSAEVVDHRAVGQDRLRHVGELAGEDLRGARHQGAPGVIVCRGALTCAQDLDERAPLGRALVETIQRLERALVRRLLGEALLPRRDRGRQVRQDALGELAKTSEELAPDLAPLLQLHLDRQHLRDVRAPPRRAVDPLEGARGRKGQRRVLRVDLEHTPVDALRPQRIADRVLEEGGDGA